jgi:PAS domain S-box-containing protein
MDDKGTRRGGSEAPPAAKLPAGHLKDLGLDVVGAALDRTRDGVVFLDRHLRCLFANPAACTLLGYAPDKLLGRDFLTSLKLEQPYVRDALAAGESGRWEAVIRRPDGSELDILCNLTRLDGGFALLCLQDDSERRRQAREAAALAQAAARAAANDSIDATVQSLAQSALQGTRALGAMVLLDDEDDIAVWIGVSGLPDGYAESLRAAIGAGYRPPYYETVVTGQRILLERDARRRREADPMYAGPAEVLRPVPWQAAVIAPLIYQRAVVGTLNALYRQDELPSEGEMAFLATLADQAAVVAMNARLMTAARDKVALEERQRLARELHDSVSQALYGIALGARTARDRLEHDPAAVAEPIDYVLQLAEAGMAEMRALIFELRPEALETEGLVAALNKQVDAVRARHGLAARTAAGEEPDSPLEVKQALYRIAQEALQNTVKHARARRVEVRLEAPAGEVRLAIEDDGVGFEPDRSFPGHLGLRSMRERALGVGGSMEVTSAPGGGTRILISVPLPPQARTRVA